MHPPDLGRWRALDKRALPPAFPHALKRTNPPLDADPDGSGLACDERGVYLARLPLLHVGVWRRLEPRPLRELAPILRAAYPPEERPDPESFANGLGRIAAALHRQDRDPKALSLAAILTVQLSVPRLRAGALQRLTKAGFDPGEPRDWHGEWTGDGDGLGASVDEDDPLAGLFSGQGNWSSQDDNSSEDARTDEDSNFPRAMLASATGRDDGRSTDSDHTDSRGFAGPLPTIGDGASTLEGGAPAVEAAGAAEAGAAEVAAGTAEAAAAATSTAEAAAATAGAAGVGAAALAAGAVVGAGALLYSTPTAGPVTTPVEDHPGFEITRNDDALSVIISRTNDDGTKTVVAEGRPNVTPEGGLEWRDDHGVQIAVQSKDGKQVPTWWSMTDDHDRKGCPELVFDKQDGNGGSPASWAYQLSVPGGAPRGWNYPVNGGKFDACTRYPDGLGEAKYGKAGLIATKFGDGVLAADVEQAGRLNTAATGAGWVIPTYYASQAAYAAALKERLDDAGYKNNVRVYP